MKKCDGRYYRAVSVSICCCRMSNASQATEQWPLDSGNTALRFDSQQRLDSMLRCGGNRWKK